MPESDSESEEPGAVLLAEPDAAEDPELTSMLVITELIPVLLVLEIVGDEIPVPSPVVVVVVAVVEDATDKLRRVLLPRGLVVDVTTEELVVLTEELIVLVEEGVYPE